MLHHVMPNAAGVLTTLRRTVGVFVAVAGLLAAPEVLVADEAGEVPAATTSASPPADAEQDKGSKDHSKRPSEDASDEPTETAEYVGDDMCRVCHQDLTETYDKTVHGWALAVEGQLPADHGCEACHGPGSLHVAAGGSEPGGLQTFASDRPATERSAACLRCHGSAPDVHPFRSSTHAASGLACTSCHTGHDAPKDHLLRTAPPELCYACHLEVRAEFALPEHHRVNEGVVGCADCHQPHGSRNLMALRGTNDATCFRCHGEIEGPFVFEHAAVETEGCAGCHSPHGSVNRHLLKYQQVAQLCYQCHTVTPADHVQPSFRQCTNCHVSIHGSNIDPRFLEQ